MALTGDYNYLMGGYLNISEKIGLDEYKLILFLISRMDNASSRVTKLSFKEYNRIFAVDENDTYRKFRNLGEDLIKRQIRIEKAYNKFILINWFSSIAYCSDVLEIRFNYDLVPFLMRFNKHLKKYPIDYIASGENLKYLKSGTRLFGNLYNDIMQNDSVG